MVPDFGGFFLPPLREVAKHEEHSQQGNPRQKHCRILGYYSYNSFPMAEQSSWLVIIHCYNVNPTPFCPQSLSQVFYINTHTHTQFVYIKAQNVSVIYICSIYFSPVPLHFRLSSSLKVYHSVARMSSDNQLCHSGRSRISCDSFLNYPDRIKLIYLLYAG